MECLSLFSGSNIEATRPFIIIFVVEKCYHTTKSSFGCHRLIADHRCQQQLPCFSRQPCCAHTSAGSQPTKINNKRGSKTMWRRVSCRTTPDSRAPPCFLTWKHLQLWFNIWPTEPASCAALQRFLRRCGWKHIVLCEASEPGRSPWHAQVCPPTYPETNPSLERCGSSCRVAMDMD